VSNPRQAKGDDITILIFQPIPVPVEILKVKDSKPTYKTHAAALTAFDFDKDFSLSKEHSAGSNHYQQIQQPNYFSFQSSGYGNVDQDDTTRRTKPTAVNKKKKKKNKDKFESYYKTQEQYQQQEKKEKEEKERKQQEEIKDMNEKHKEKELQLQEQHKHLQEQLRQQQQQFVQLQHISQQLMQHSLPQTQTEQWMAHVTHPSTQVESTTAHGSQQLHTSFIHSKDPMQSASNTHEILVGPSGSGGEYYPTNMDYQLQDQPQAQALVQDYGQSNFDYPINPYEMSPMQQEQQEQLQQFANYGMM
jgi:flagellar biosynthesis GTPase FlhF